MEKERNEKCNCCQGESAALSILSLFDTQVQRLKVRYTSLRKAIDALDLDNAVDMRLDPIISEVKGFKEVWSALGDIWNSVDRKRILYGRIFTS